MSEREHGEPALRPDEAGDDEARLLSRKQHIREILQALAALAARAGLASTARDIHEVRLPKLEDERFSLVVIGEFNHGKSTFLNALLGEELLPVGATPTTAALAEIRHGDGFAARAVMEDGSRQPIERAQLADWLRGKHPPGAAPLDRVEITMPLAFLADRLTVVDTPGVNDLSEQRADITYGYVPRADAIIFLLDATQVLSASERQFLQERVLRSARDRLLFVVAKSDLLDDSERAEVETFVREQLTAIVPDPTVFFVSAKRALRGPPPAPGGNGVSHPDVSGMAALRTHLARTLGQDRRRLVLDHALADAERLARFIRQSFAMRRASLGLSRADLEERVRRARARLVDGKRALNEANDTIRAETAALRARVQQDLSVIIEALAGELPVELARAEAADVETYLAPFLEDTLKGWVENEGEVMAVTLEALAEKVVAIASEKLDAIGETVAHDLGMQEPDLRVNAPALEYEASVFALGALGTTALVFVNTLMGGMVALLTPALAALVRARAMRAARDEAVRRAPEMVRKLGAELSPRLDQVIEDFAARLEAFIAEAGAALARGITEVLESALAAHEAGDLPAGKVDGALAEDLQKLKAIEARIVDTRQSVWGSSIG